MVLPWGREVGLLQVRVLSQGSFQPTQRWFKDLFLGKGEDGRQWALIGGLRHLAWQGWRAKARGSWRLKPGLWPDRLWFWAGSGGQGLGAPQGKACKQLARSALPLPCLLGPLPLNWVSLAGRLAVGRVEEEVSTRKIGSAFGLPVYQFHLSTWLIPHCGCWWRV